MRAIAAIPPHASRPNSWPTKPTSPGMRNTFPMEGGGMATPDWNNTQMDGKGNRSPTACATVGKLNQTLCQPTPRLTGSSPIEKPPGRNRKICRPERLTCFNV